MARPLHILALTLSVATLLAASCQHEPPAAEPTTPPEVSETPTAKKPQLPSKAQDGDYAGAVAFVEHYYELYEYGRKTADWKPLKEASAPDCDGCEKLWQPEPFRKIDHDTVSTNPASLDDLIDGVARVNVSITDAERTKMNGDLRLSWIDTVKCTFDDGRWLVTSFEAQTS